jgi:transcriptional regulator with GAF, ATPase, and Fis domain
LAERTLIGEHPTVVKLRALVDRVAATDATVLITGESGTGKEVVARTTHTLSARRNRAFVPVNCAAIPHELLESEMFGHERGAFTGALGPRHGLFSTADGGTIFLDEIGEMPLQLQAKLLRVLEDGIVRPVGSDRASRIDARVIAASNSDLAAGVKKGSFREDLFYRLQWCRSRLRRCASAARTSRCWSSTFSRACTRALLAAIGRSRRPRW